MWIDPRPLYWRAAIALVVFVALIGTIVLTIMFCVQTAESRRHVTAAMDSAGAAAPQGK